VQKEPHVMRDLQRACTLCASKRRCGRDLAANPSGPAWEAYCPNASTLHALITERSIQSKSKGS
jgi:positive regulator of sigma E activity